MDLSSLLMKVFSIILLSLLPTQVGKLVSYSMAILSSFEYTENNPVIGLVQLKTGQRRGHEFLASLCFPHWLARNGIWVLEINKTPESIMHLHASLVPHPVKLFPFPYIIWDLKLQWSTISLWIPPAPHGTVKMQCLYAQHFPSF